MIGWLARTGFRRGILGGRRAWAVVGVTAMGIRLVRRFLGDEPTVVFTETLKPGDTFVVASDQEATVRGRRLVRRQRRGGRETIERR